MKEYLRWIIGISGLVGVAASIILLGTISYKYRKEIKSRLISAYDSVKSKVCVCVTVEDEKIEEGRPGNEKLREELKKKLEERERLSRSEEWKKLVNQVEELKLEQEKLSEYYKKVDKEREQREREREQEDKEREQRKKEDAERKAQEEKDELEHKKQIQKIEEDIQKDIERIERDSKISLEEERIRGKFLDSIIKMVGSHRALLRADTYHTQVLSTLSDPATFLQYTPEQRTTNVEIANAVLSHKHDEAEKTMGDCLKALDELNKVSGNIVLADHSNGQVLDGCSND
jgi:hypothetical protein